MPSIVAVLMILTFASAAGAAEKGDPGKPHGENATMFNMGKDQPPTGRNADKGQATSGTPSSPTHTPKQH